MKIHVDFELPEDAWALLRSGTGAHTLLVPEQRATSVLASGGGDPGLLEADVAFGQPDPEAVARAPRLKWIQVSTSGITRYDTPVFRELVRSRGIAVCNAARVYAEACAVHAASFILAHTRNLPRSLGARDPSDSPAWKALRRAGTTLQGQTVLILGFGTIGRRLAEMLRPFGARVVAYRRTPRGDEGVPVVASDMDLTRILGHEVDHIVNILPDSPSTRGFFGRERFDGVRPGAVFHNIGRGVTVDQDALAAALRSGRIAAAWLDVTDPEPLPAGHPLTVLPNCHITPHIAGGHRGEGVTLVRHFLENLERWTRGEALVDRVM